MNATRILRWPALIFAGAILLAGCQSGGGGHGKNANGGSGGKSVSFNYDMPYQLEQVGGAEGALTRAFTASDVFTGTLMATNTDTSEAQTFDWSVYLDETTLAVQSNKTIVLDPGTYDFVLLLHKGDHAYVGVALDVSIADGTDNVPLTIRPVIGDVTTNVSVVAHLIDLRFSYDPAEFAGAGIADPQIGIAVDGGSEQLFAVSPATGFSEYMYLNLSPGAHDIVLRLFDGAIQRGKSLTAQQHQTLSPGVGVTMDLVALHGETTFSLAEGTGDATFHFVIPAEVVNEAGGTVDLQALLHIVRTESAANPADEQALSLSPSGGDYVANVTLHGFQFEAITIALSFTDIADDYLLGSCISVVDLTDAAQTHLCDLTLVRRAVISGNLLATLGVNVFDTLHQPTAGAVVRANGNVVGVTGSGGFGTPGYLRVFLHAGSYTIHADNGSLSGEHGVTLDPLDIDNVDVTLDTPLLVHFTGIQQNVPVASLAGWSQCYVDQYGNNSGTPIAGILAGCNKANLMLACRPTGSGILQLLAHAPRGDVLTDTGVGSNGIVHAANSVAWYYSPNWSWGFAPPGVPVSKNSCDVGGDPGSAQRMCWHTGNQVTPPATMAYGYRCGNNFSFSSDYERLIYQAD